MFMEEYPEHTWKRWRFVQVPRRYWADIAHKLHDALNPSQQATAKAIVLDYIQSIEKQYNITDLSEWQDLINSKHRYLRLLTQSQRLNIEVLGGLPTVLSTVYPDHQWTHSKFSKRT